MKKMTRYFISISLCFFSLSLFGADIDFVSEYIESAESLEEGVQRSLNEGSQFIILLQVQDTAKQDKPEGELLQLIEGAVGEGIVLLDAPAQLSRGSEIVLFILTDYEIYKKFVQFEEKAVQNSVSNDDFQSYPQAESSSFSEQGQATVQPYSDPLPDPYARNFDHLLTDNPDLAGHLTQARSENGQVLRVPPGYEGNPWIYFMHDADSIAPGIRSAQRRYEEKQAEANSEISAERMAELMRHDDSFKRPKSRTTVRHGGANSTATARATASSSVKININTRPTAGLPGFNFGGSSGGSYGAGYSGGGHGGGVSNTNRFARENRGKVGRAIYDTFHSRPIRSPFVPISRSALSRGGIPYSP